VTISILLLIEMKIDCDLLYKSIYGMMINLF